MLPGAVEDALTDDWSEGCGVADTGVGTWAEQAHGLLIVIAEIAIAEITIARIDLDWNWAGKGEFSVPFLHLPSRSPK
jgi:hypothetical protein